ncbi:glutaredoxin family protein [Povalibacter uvarum]|nr:glutaredoxin family protein [Povalibacter uvarum]
MVRWTVYTRTGCTLCEELMVQLAEVLGEAASDVAVIDIADDPELEARYGRRIPVLMADDDFVCSYRLDLDRVRGYLRQGG